MANFVEWDTVEPAKKGGGKGGNNGRYARIEPNKEYIIRPLFKAVEFFKYTLQDANGKFRTAVVEDADKCLVRPKYASLRRASARRGFLAFNRTEGNKLQIFELPSSALEAFKHFKNVTKKEPGGPEGGDFKLKAICPTGKKDRNTTYSIEFDKASTFTEEERLFVNENVRDKEKASGFKEDWDLTKIFASHSAEEIERRLFGKLPVSNQGSAPQQAASQVPAAGGKTDDFNW